MTAYDLYKLVEHWKNLTYLKECSLIFEDDIYTEALRNFKYD